MGHRTSSIINQQDEKTEPSTLSNDYYIRRILKRNGHIDFDVETWYPILESETFTTRFISISPSLARAFVNSYQTRYNSKNLLTSTDLEEIQRIENDLKEQMIGDVFIRLSSRSPKDGNPLDKQRLNQIYHLELTRLQEEYPNEMNSNEGIANMKFIAYSSAQSQCLKVTTAEEGLALILSSERVFMDLLEALDCHEARDIISNSVENHEWNNHIILRQWNDRLDHAMEFRCFVYESKLTAISQYNHYCKFYHLQDVTFVEQVKSIIIDYWEKTLKERLQEKYANYIIDLGLIRDEMDGKLKCLVIEMNPFESTTGASLFDWKRDHEQLTSRTNDIEIRIRSDYFPNIEEYIDFVLHENTIEQ